MNKGLRDNPKTMPQSRQYDEGYDRIFGKKKSIIRGNMRISNKYLLRLFGFRPRNDDWGFPMAATQPFWMWVKLAVHIIINKLRGKR